LKSGYAGGSPIRAYNKLAPADLERLQAIVGSDQVIFDDPDRLEPYSHDEVADPAYACMPAVVVKPASAVEISAVLKMANLRSIPVTPRGAGSGLSGGAVPACGGILLSTERMNRILEIDHENLIAVLEPGVITNDFNNEVQKEGLFFCWLPHES
jgi:glycolate oxidase